MESENQTIRQSYCFNHSKTGLVRYLDTFCILFYFKVTSFLLIHFISTYFRENPTEGRQIDVLQLMLEASEVAQIDSLTSSQSESVTSSTSDRVTSSKKPLSDDEIVANSWIFLLGVL